MGPEEADAAFVAVVRSREGEQQRVALGLTGDVGGARVVVEEAFVRLYRRWPVPEDEVDRVLAGLVRARAMAWRRGPGRDRWVEDVGGVERFAPEPLDAGEVLAMAREGRVRVAKVRPVVTAAVLVVVGALALGVGPGAVERVTREETPAPRPVVEDAAVTSGPGAVSFVDLDCTPSAGRPREEVVVAAGEGGVSVRVRVQALGEADTAHEFIWTSESQASGVEMLTGSGTLVVPIPPGRGAVECLDPVSGPSGGVALQVQDPEGFYRGGLDSVGCGQATEVSRREYRGPSVGAALAALQEDAPVVRLVEDTTAYDGELTLQEVQTGYPVAAPTYLALREGVPDFAVVMEEDDAGWTARLTLVCALPGQLSADPASEGATPRPTTLMLTCDDGGAQVALAPRRDGQTVVVDHPGVAVVGASEGLGLRARWSSGDEEGVVETDPGGAVHAPIPPGTATLVCLGPGDQEMGKALPLTLVDPNGAWGGTLADLGCDPRPLQGEPVRFVVQDGQADLYAEIRRRLAGAGYPIGLGDVTVGYFGDEVTTQLIGPDADGVRFVVELSYEDGFVVEVVASCG